MAQNISYIPINNRPESIAKPTVCTAKFQSPVIFMCNGIGDGLLALPAIRALSLMFEDKLTIVYDSVVTPYWLYQLPLNKIVLIEAYRDENDIFFDYQSTAEQVIKCDLFISLIFTYSRCLENLIKLIKPTKTIGFHRSFDIYVEQSNNQHISDVYFKIPKVFLPSVDISYYHYPLGNIHTADKLAEKILMTIQVNADNPSIVAIHADTQSDKMWTEQSWLELFHLINLENPNTTFFVFGMSLVFEIKNDRVYDFTRLPFEISIALINLCDVFIGVDSCLLHAADLLNIPGVGLFFSTDPLIWGYRFADSFKNLKHTASRQITPQRVFDVLSRNKGWVKNEF